MTPGQWKFSLNMWLENDNENLHANNKFSPHEKIPWSNRIIFVYFIYWVFENVIAKLLTILRNHALNVS